MIAIEPLRSEHVTECVAQHTKTIAPSKIDAAYAESRAFWQAAGFVPLDEHLLWGPHNPCLVLVKVLV